MLGNVAGLTILASRVGDSHFTISKNIQGFPTCNRTIYTLEGNVATVAESSLVTCCYSNNCRAILNRWKNVIHRHYKLCSVIR